MSARVLILGASYGLLPAVRLALAGYAIELVGRAEEIAAMAREDLRLCLPARRSGDAAQLAVSPGTAVRLTTPDHARPEQADLVILAMQEPQYAEASVASLIGRIGAGQLPCLSIMNLPPPPFLARLGIDDPALLDGVYSSMAAWQGLSADQVTLASPDAQALRLDPARPGCLTVTLPSNFKAAPFARAADQRLLERAARDWAGVKAAGQRPPVQLLAQHSLTVPLAKWPMLIAGNCRCLTATGIRPIAEAVHHDLDASAALYSLVSDLALSLGAQGGDMVPFAAYARAAQGLTRPSSLARALANGAQAVERIDLLIQRLLSRARMDAAPLAPIVSLIEERLAANRA